MRNAKTEVSKSSTNARENQHVKMESGLDLSCLIQTTVMKDQTELQAARIARFLRDGLVKLYKSAKMEADPRCISVERITWTSIITDFDLLQHSN